MTRLWFIFLLMFCSAATAAADPQAAIIFSQEVIAINADGSLVPPVKITPETMDGMRTFDFDLGRERLLQIHTNISNPEERGLSDVVATVKNCYNYIESSTGKKLNQGVMLYLIELEEPPYAYSFNASYADASKWGQVRLALLDHGAPLSGPQAPTSLSDLLYDTLPHELGHDVLNGVPQLLHDIDGDVSNHTRWFIEGICEVLAKGFSQRAAPDLYEHFIHLRNVATVLAEMQMRNDLMNWSQTNDNGMALESDLYGAAMLTLMTWTEAIPLSELLDKLEARSGAVGSPGLIGLMQETSGIGPQEMLSRAHDRGMQLGKQRVLAQLESK